MSNKYLFFTSMVFFFLNLYTNYVSTLPLYIFELSLIAGITSILNHYFDNQIIQMIDRIYITTYVIYMFISIEKTILRIILITIGVLSVSSAMYMRDVFRFDEVFHFNILTAQKHATLCVLLHLLSHCILIYVYLDLFLL